MKFDGTNWVNVGSPGFSSGEAYYTSLAFNSTNEAFVVYRDAGNANKATVMKFDGTDWVALGTAGFTAGYADFTSIKIDNNDEVYIAFTDLVSFYKATVMKFEGGTSSTSNLLKNETEIVVYPNPTYNEINFTKQVNVQLIDLNGHIITNERNTTKLDLSNQSTGIYFIKLTDENGQVLKRSKIVKK